MHSYIPMNTIILVTWIIEGLDNRGPDNRGLTVSGNIIVAIVNNPFPPAVYCHSILGDMCQL